MQNARSDLRAAGVGVGQREPFQAVPRHGASLPITSASVRNEPMTGALAKPFGHRGITFDERNRENGLASDTIDQ
jgi:hypothetical protein